MNYALILAGGSGSRFWPMSRRHLPKQFLKIVEKKSLLEATINRARHIIPDDNIFIITNQIYLNQIKKQLSNFKIPKRNIILEPTPKNTLPAISLCAQLVRLKDPQANILVLPSDHYIKDNNAFKHSAEEAFRLAGDGFLSLIGIKPDSPRSGYGYIRTGKKMAKDIYRVQQFQEKPSVREARNLLSKRGIFWNSGISCFKAAILAEETKRYLPALYHQIVKVRNRQDISKVWPKIKPASIDYGLLEKSDNLIMVIGKFRWSDLGSWDTLSELLPKDRKDNVVLSDCDCITLDSSNTLVCSYEHKRLIACVGLKDLVVVDTPDALLVCKKDKSQDIKALVGLLKKKRKKCV